MNERELAPSALPSSGSALELGIGTSWLILSSFESSDNSDVIWDETESITVYVKLTGAGNIY